MLKKSHKFFDPQKIKYLQIGLLCALAVFAAWNAGPAAASVFNVLASASGQTRKLPIYSVDVPKKQVAISFDAAWGADDTDTILGILRDNGVKATFFLCGFWVDKYPDEVKKIYEAGHDIGSHGNTHAHGNQLSLAQNEAEITAVGDKIRNLLGIRIDLFRPPFGEYNNTVIQAAEDSGYYPIQWSVDSHDWMGKGQEYEINRVLNNKNLTNGAIILFHNDAKDTPKTLPIIIKGLKDKGYEIVPISQLIYKTDYYIDHTGRQTPKTGGQPGEALIAQ